MLNYPKCYRLSSGTASDAYQMVSFDSALIDAGISNYNLLRVSSILPIGCIQNDHIDVKEGSALLVAYGTISSNVPGQRIASAVGVGIPEDESMVGVIMEYADVGTAEIAEDAVRNMVSRAMKNHDIPCKDILVSSAETIVTDDYATVVSAVALW